MFSFFTLAFYPRAEAGNSSRFPAEPEAGLVNGGGDVVRRPSVDVPSHLRASWRKGDGVLAPSTLLRYVFVFPVMLVAVWCGRECAWEGLSSNTRTQRVGGSVCGRFAISCCQCPLKLLQKSTDESCVCLNRPLRRVAGRYVSVCSWIGWITSSTSRTRRKGIGTFVISCPASNLSSFSCRLGLSTG
jgi:hypothetical protein